MINCKMILLKSNPKLIHKRMIELHFQSREIADDFHHIEKRDLNSSSVEACQVDSLRPRNARRALRPCLPIVDIEPFRKLLLEEDCNTGRIPSCTIMDYYIRRCAAEGILIEASCD